MIRADDSRLVIKDYLNGDLNFDILLDMFNLEICSHSKKIEFKEVVIAYETKGLTLGEVIKVNDGPFKGMNGKIMSIENTITVLIDLFGQETPIQVDLSQIEKA